MCLKICPPGPSAPQPGDPAQGDEALRCHLTLHGISDTSGKSLGTVTRVNYPEDD